jgi:N-acetylglucosaminyldiphosphoundecaprenol N-acetyl-beta-D-mannosaminyltransferase
VDGEQPAVKERISLLKVPLDIVPQENLAECINELLAGSGGKNIVLLSLWDLLRARRTGEYRSYVTGAALIIPISKSIVGGVRFLTGKRAVRYMPFDFIVQLLTILEERELSLYLLGGKKQILQLTEKNIRQTFPRLRVLGRYAGAFKKQEEGTLLQAIRKAAPSLLLVGQGVHGGEQWIAKNNTHLSGGLRLWCSDLYEIFAKRKKRPSQYVFDHGLEWIGFSFSCPLRLFRIFPYFYYKLLLVIHRLFVK